MAYVLFCFGLKNWEFILDFGHGNQGSEIC